MQVIITGRHFAISNLIRQYAGEKIEALFHDYPTLKVSSVRVTLDIDRTNQVKVGICAAVKKQLMFAEGMELDLHKALDHAVNRIQSQLDRYVDRYKRPEPTPPARELEMAFAAMREA